MYGSNLMVLILGVRMRHSVALQRPTSRGSACLSGGSGVKVRGHKRGPIPPPPARRGGVRGAGPEKELHLPRIEI